MPEFFSSNFKLGILGGGQLGKMLLRETARLDIKTAVLDPAADAPCAGLTPLFETGDLMDYETVIQFGEKCDLVTIEIEHVNVEALKSLESQGTKVYPKPAMIELIQDKTRQKDFYKAKGIPTAPYHKFKSPADLDASLLKYPCVYKAAQFGYDGKGVQILKSKDDFDALPEQGGLIEEFLTDAKEIAVIVARNPSGDIKVYPSVEMDFHPEANLVEFIFSPAALPPEIEKKAREIALETAKAFELVGIIAVEMFLTTDGRILVNEVAPRPHNSGHLTIENFYTNQYDMHLRAILDLPLGSVEAKTSAIMVNLLGEPGHTGRPVYSGIKECLALPGVNVHLYGKEQTRPFRKMGHVTILDNQLVDAYEKAIFVKKTLKVIT